MVFEPEQEKAQAKPAAETRAPMLAPVSDTAAQPEQAGTSRLGIISVAILAAGVATTFVFKNEIMEAPLFRAPGITQSDTNDLSDVRFSVAGPAAEQRAQRDAAAAAAAQVTGKPAGYTAPYPADNPSLFELALLPPAIGAAAAGYKASPAAHGTFTPDAPAQTVQMIGHNSGQYVYEVANNSGRAWTGHLTFPASGETWDVKVLAGGTVRIQTAAMIDDFHPLVGYLTQKAGAGN